MITELIQGQWVVVMIAGISAVVCPFLCWKMAITVRDRYGQS